VADLWELAFLWERIEAEIAFFPVPVDYVQGVFELIPLKSLALSP
jgi:hypothetical protein